MSALPQAFDALDRSDARTSVPHPRRVSERSSAPVEVFDATDRVRVEVVTSIERLLDVKSDYDHLNEVTRNTLPFALHEWHVAWWRHLSTFSASIRDTLMIHVVRDEAARAVAIVPLVLTRRAQFGFQVASIAAVGSDPFLTEIRAPLVAVGQELRSLSAIQQCLSEDPRWDWILWTGLNPQLAQAVDVLCPRNSCSLRWLQPLDDGVLDLEPTWDAFQAKLKRNIRESLRHCRNSLKREGLKVEFEVAHTRTDVKRALDAFVGLHSMRAQVRGMVEHFDRFANPKARRFLYDVCDDLAGRDAARVFLLKIGGQLVAARVGFVVGEGLYLYYSGFDPAWKKYSVMTTTVAEAIKYAISCGLRTVNLSAGLDVSKTRWGVRRLFFAQALQSRLRLRSRLALAVYRQAVDKKSFPLLGTVVRALPMRSWT